MVEQWAKIRRFGGGDDMKASTMDSVNIEDRRDATWIRYDMLVDINSNSRTADEELEREEFYGQLQNIFVVHFPCSPRIGVNSETTFFLAGIQKCADIEFRNGMRMPYYKKMGGYEVVDVGCVQCLIGRIQATPTHTAIIDRHGALQRSFYVNDDANAVVNDNLIDGE
ncbi:hypothetical protein VKT23_015099 [Stygiomarasmius scandens]|uniref:PAZ domain-containing protein n=1 Tax=Marasmiellus scandens TaxID=2682957 RepID=A0ABR1J367_9AGAR